jgi:hypothetical protein
VLSFFSCSWWIGGNDETTKADKEDMEREYFSFGSVCYHCCMFIKLMHFFFTIVVCF